MIRVHHADLQAFTARLLVALGLADVDAQVTADLLVEANLRGIDTHGVARLPQYAQSLSTGKVNPHPNVRVAHRRGATALIDADGGYGFRPTILAVETAVSLARTHGVGLVGVQASHHFGVAGAYALRAARAGMLGFVTTNSSPVLAPPDGARPVVGNNPIAIATPRRKPRPPLLADISFSAVAFGRIRMAATEGTPIPSSWARDATGQPTTNAAAALAAHSLEPLGGHKGYALATMVEVLAGALTGSRIGLDSDPHDHLTGGVGHTVIAVDPGTLVGRDSYENGVEALAASIEQMPAASATARVYLPGAPEEEAQKRRTENGIPLSARLASSLRALADDFGVPHF